MRRRCQARDASTRARLGGALVARAPQRRRATEYTHSSAAIEVAALPVGE